MLSAFQMTIGVHHMPVDSKVGQHDSCAGILFYLSASSPFSLETFRSEFCIAISGYLIMNSRLVFYLWRERGFWIQPSASWSMLQSDFKDLEGGCLSSWSKKAHSLSAEHSQCVSASAWVFVKVPWRQFFHIVMDRMRLDCLSGSSLVLQERHRGANWHDKYG